MLLNLWMHNESKDSSSELFKWDLILFLDNMKSTIDRSG